MTSSQIRDAYAARAAEYATLLGSMDVMHPADRRLIMRWAKSVTGTIVDVGCGPGHWTEFIRGLGCSVHGLDPVPEFIALAQQAFPDTSFREGSCGDLAINSAGGILAWYSFIHHRPADVKTDLGHCWAALRPGGLILLGFFDGPQLAPFEHAITTAYAWPAEELASLLEQAGFTILETAQRHEPAARAHGALLARRS